MTSSSTESPFSKFSGQRMVPLAVTDDGTTATVYLNGVKVGTGNNSFGNDLVIDGGQDCLIDEIMIYDRVLKDFELMQLSGRVFLDLSGSKFHAAPIGGFDMNDSDPTGANDGLADSPTLGFSVNNLGQGIDLNGSQYLDLTAHTVELKERRRQPRRFGPRNFFNLAKTRQGPCHKRL